MWLILPHKDVEITNTNKHVVIPIGDRWECMFFKDHEQADRFERGLNELIEATSRLTEEERFALAMQLRSKGGVS